MQDVFEIAAFEAYEENPTDLYRSTMVGCRKTDNRQSSSSNREKIPLDTSALRMNIILKSILSLKHMRHTFSSQAIEEKKSKDPRTAAAV